MKSEEAATTWQQQISLGSTRDFEIFVCVDQGQAVVSSCQFLLTVGTADNNSAQGYIINIKHKGYLSGAVHFFRDGSQLCNVYLKPFKMDSGNEHYWLYSHRYSGTDSKETLALPAVDVYEPWLKALVAGGSSDIVYMGNMRFVLRSEQ